MRKKVELDLEKLNDLYFVQNKTLREVAEIFKVSSFAVYKNIKKQNIQRRTLSEAMKMAWAKKSIKVTTVL